MRQTSDQITTQSPRGANSQQLCNIIVASLTAQKALDVQAIDLRGKSDFTDFMIIASGNVGRHVQAMADKIIRQLKQDFAIFPAMEGARQGDWILIDGHSVVIHLFRPEVRAYYNLDGMWQDSVQAATDTPAKQL